MISSLLILQSLRRPCHFRITANSRIRAKMHKIFNNFGNFWSMDPICGVRCLQLLRRNWRPIVFTVLAVLLRSDRQTDRQIGRQRDRKTERQIDRETERQTDRQKDRQTEFVLVDLVDLNHSTLLNPRLSLTFSDSKNCFKFEHLCQICAFIFAIYP